MTERSIGTRAGFYLSRPRKLHDYPGFYRVSFLRVIPGTGWGEVDDRTDEAVCLVDANCDRVVWTKLLHPPLNGHDAAAFEAAAIRLARAEYAAGVRVPSARPR